MIQQRMVPTIFVLVIDTITTAQMMFIGWDMQFWQVIQRNIYRVTTLQTM